jgi:hypothetical protein
VNYTAIDASQSVQPVAAITSWSVCACVGTLWTMTDSQVRQRYVGALKRVSGSSYWGRFEYVVVFRRYIARS